MLPLYKLYESEMSESHNKALQHISRLMRKFIDFFAHVTKLTSK